MIKATFGAERDLENRALIHRVENTSDSKSLDPAAYGTYEIKSNVKGNNNEKEQRRSKFKLNMDAIRFATRLTTILTVASLFMLVKLPNGKPYPSGSWVFITCIVVSWYPAMDVASVVEKACHRILGTICGGTIGLALGYQSLGFSSESSQAVFLELSTAVLVFLITFAFIQWKPILGKYFYVDIIGLLTYGIAVAPFCTDSNDPFKHAALRICNVVIGCIISCSGAILIWPRSTSDVVRDILAKQIVLAAEATEAVLLQAAETFSGGKAPLGITPLLRKGGTDSVHKKYTAATNQLRSAKQLLPFLDSDPMRSFSQHTDHLSRAEAEIILDRAFRVQTTVIMIDGIVRARRSLLFTSEQLNLVKQTANLLKTFLLDEVSCERLEQDIFHKFKQIHKHKAASCIAHAAFFNSVGDGEFEPALSLLKKDEWMEMLSSGDILPLLDYDTKDYGLMLFFGILESLILRCLRLHFSWQCLNGEKDCFEPALDDDVNISLRPSRSENRLAELIKKESKRGLVEKFYKNS